MQSRGIHLQYSFESRGQRGPELENELFDLLNAVREHGSIRHVAVAMEASYRHVWGLLKRWEQTLGEPLVQWTQGRPARLTAFALRLLAAERQARARMTPHIEALRAELEHVLAQALDGGQLALEVFASHDMGLPLLRELAQQRQLHVGLRFAGSVDALRALAQGRCTVAGFHVPALPEGSPVFASALKPLLKPGIHKLIGCLRRTQGLMVRPTGVEERSLSLADLAGSGLRFVNRQPGSGTRLLLDHLLQVAKLDPVSIEGYDARAEDSHLAVAAAIAAGQGYVGLGIEAAAREFGLDFVPLIEEDYYLVCLKEALDSPAVSALCSLLGSTEWLAALKTLPGYAASQTGTGRVLSLTQALPWWHFKTPRPARQDDVAEHRREGVEQGRGSAER